MRWKDGAMPQCVILLFDGFDELDALAPYEVLRRAEEAGAPFSTSLVSREGAREVSAFYGTRIQAEAALTLEARPDLLIVPGGGWNHRGENGVRVEVERGELPQLIARLHVAGTTVAGVCTGAMLLAAAGLTKGRPATTHHLAHEELQLMGAEVYDARVVDDGDVITSAGVTSGLDLALWLVERFASPAVARAVERRLEYERRGVVWRRTT
jgi:transcriptional regulator GlxA family with amidase domain